MNSLNYRATSATLVHLGGFRYPRNKMLIGEIALDVVQELLSTEIKSGGGSSVSARTLDKLCSTHHNRD